MRAILVVALVLSAPVFARGGGSVRVSGHITKSGEYVAPHVRTAPDSSKANNWSSKGNVNPYSGKKGTK